MGLGAGNGLAGAVFGNSLGAPVFDRTFVEPAVAGITGRRNGLAFAACLSRAALRRIWFRAAQTGSSQDHGISQAILSGFGVHFGRHYEIANIRTRLDSE